MIAFMTMMWVHGNATEHIYEDITAQFYKQMKKGEGLAYTNPNLYSQMVMSDFYGSLEKAIDSEIIYEEIINQGNWEFIFSKPRENGLLPVVKHAKFNGWH